MEKKFKLKKDGQPLSMPCTKEQWEALKPELDEIEGVNCEEITDTFDKEPILVNNCGNCFGGVANMGSYCVNDFDRTYLPTHDKEAFLSSLRGEPIVKEEVKQPVTFNDEYWEKLYHECAMKLCANGDMYPTVASVIKDAKALIEELKNNPLK